MAFIRKKGGDTRRALAALAGAVRLSRTPAEVGAIFRQIEKTRWNAPLRPIARTRALAAWVGEEINLAGKDVLCAGTGDAREMACLRELGATPTGIDLSPAPGVLAMNMERMTFADARFDLVYACHSLEHAKDQAAAVAEFVRVVKPGGHVAIEVPVNPTPNRVDRHACLALEDVAALFAACPGTMVRAEFVSGHDPRNGEGGDVCRFLYRKG